MPAFIRAAVQAGHKYNPDFNGATQEGVGWMDSNVSDGIRQSASRCYLLPALSRKNLNVISNATVSRILLQDKRAVGVEYIDSNGEKHTVKATKEVLLCGGAYNSPQILMLSGIGDPATLEKVGIETLHELPGVGQNLQDHLYLGLTERRSSPGTIVSTGQLEERLDRSNARAVGESERRAGVPGTHSRHVTSSRQTSSKRLPICCASWRQ